ncbi:NAD-dependent epimerase/dehydratase family protein [Wohlfahrtiimonas larvae]|uniref:NAD-dependent epimerase/dehydratase family protein n=1 Tax=Wohlfahrtiimonas larvae TaxID=1157986 RepID=A0ABP9MAE2_9GAMM|nr:NAD(P)-dependent oxidoreductase [Wohlfahrtiimonas larvae]
MKNFDQEYMSFIESSKFNWEHLKCKTILISGATGLIGKTLVNLIFKANQLYKLDVQLICLVRDVVKARTLFTDMDIVLLYSYDMCDDIQINEKIDYIIHAASMTQSHDFIKKPVDVIQTAVGSINNLLNFAMENTISSFVYLSTMEVYGKNQLARKITENDYGYLDITSIRNSYPISKQLAENLCSSYYSQYNVPTKIARLTLTFGPGIGEDDNRVFAQFMRSAIKGEDIVLHTEGKTCRDYIYTLDAAMALLYILVYGNNGEAYNVANSSTYCSIREMAELIAKESINKVSKVVLMPPSADILSSYAPEVEINLDTSKLESLGWKPNFSFEEMIENTLSSLKSSLRP